MLERSSPITSKQNRLTDWWQTFFVSDSTGIKTPYRLRLLQDASLKNPDRPYEACSVQEIQALRIDSGSEPAIRTVVHSNRTGHTVQFFLLQDHRHSNAAQPGSTPNMEAPDVSHVKEEV